MTTLKVGIASYEEMKARTMAVARGTSLCQFSAIRSGCSCEASLCLGRKN